MSVQVEGFTWKNSERGHFHKDFFPPVDIPTIPHKPWVKCNIPIPPGLYDEVCRNIQTKIDAGVYEPSNSSYCSCLFKHSIAAIAAIVYKASIYKSPLYSAL